MMGFLKFLFPLYTDNKNISLFLLTVRILFGVLFLTHGLQKLSNFDTLSATFPDPLGVGSSVSLGLAIFGEVACSLGFIFGICYRLALIPMIFTMGMAFFVIHGSDPFAVKELALVYLFVFGLMFVAGPGAYALDRFIAVPLSKKR